MKDRKQRVRYKTKSVSNRKRLSVFRSNNHIYAQLIDDKKGTTLASSSSTEKSIKDMKAGEKAALLFRPNLGVTFYASDRFNITIDNVEFANSYIDIWLGENTARPKLREQITGQIK